MTADLTAWLLARITEREADVERRGTYAVGHSDWCIFEGGCEGSGWCDCGAVARALAECAALRRIVEAADEATGLDIQVDNEFGVGARDMNDEPYLGDVILRALATIWADHPTYDAEWRLT